jgi:hypothetical protein
VAENRPVTPLPGGSWRWRGGDRRIREQLQTIESFWVLSGLILDGGIGGKAGWAEDPDGPRVEGHFG